MPGSCNAQSAQLIHQSDQLIHQSAQLISGNLSAATCLQRHPLAQLMLSYETRLPQSPPKYDTAT